MLNDVGSCCGNTDKINSLSPDFLVAYFTHTLHILYTYITHTLHTHIIVEKSLMIWPDVVFAFHESHHQAHHSGHFPVSGWKNCWVFNQPSFSAEQLSFICILIDLLGCASLFRFWVIFAIMLSLKRTPSFVKLSRLTWNVPNYSRKKC